MMAYDTLYPWEIMPDRNSNGLVDSDLAYAVCGVEGGWDIAAVWKDAKNAESHARLIAAAPLLLEALIKIDNNWDNLHSKDRQQARAAIAAATGEQDAD